MNWVCNLSFFYKTVVKTYVGIWKRRSKEEMLLLLLASQISFCDFFNLKSHTCYCNYLFFHFVACFRFSLLLLEPAEIYFEDFSAFLFPLDADEHDFEKKKQIGRLKMCSKSIVFDPKDINKPLIKIPLKECISISEWDGELASRYGVLIYVELLPLCCIY